jgi:hypothetical protein
MKKSLRTIIIVAVIVIVGIVLIFTHKRPSPVVPVTTTQSTNTTTTQPGGTTSISVKAPQQTVIKIGQSGVLAGITIKVVSLMADSRCPIGVNCLQAGSFAVRTTVTKGTITTSHDFISTAGPFSFEGYDFSIAKVTPTQVKGQPTIKLLDYRITFQAVPTPKLKR